jgi:tetratricopeptide (TPR) repeat protein
LSKKVGVLAMPDDTKQQPPVGVVRIFGLPVSAGIAKQRIFISAGLLVIIGCACYCIGIQFLSSPDVEAAKTALARRDFQEASERLQKCLKARPGDLQARFLAAQTARRQGQFDSAFEHLHLYQKQVGLNAEVNLERSLLRIQQGDLSEVDAILAACAKNPQADPTPLMLEAVIEGSINALFQMISLEMAGRGQMSPSDFTRAQQVVEEWLERYPAAADQTQGLIWRGKMYAIARNQPKAQESLRKAVALDPAHSTARELLARSLLLDAPGEAAFHLQILHERNPNNSAVRFSLATVHRALGDLGPAAVLLDEMLREYPNHVPALLERGRVALDENRPADAERWLGRAVELAPGDGQANHMFSLCLQQTGRTAEAKPYLDRYLAIEGKQRPPN